jgi:phosphotransferase system  glucose/maltose/N-acetylglucosamine-specific IIC component
MTDLTVWHVIGLGAAGGFTASVLYEALKAAPRWVSIWVIAVALFVAAGMFTGLLPEVITAFF